MTSAYSVLVPRVAEAIRRRIIINVDVGETRHWLQLGVCHVARTSYVRFTVCRLGIRVTTQFILNNKNRNAPDRWRCKWIEVACKTSYAGNYSLNVSERCVSLQNMLDYFCPNKIVTHCVRADSIN